MRLHKDKILKYIETRLEESNGMKGSSYISESKNDTMELEL